MILTDDKGDADHDTFNVGMSLTMNTRKSTTADGRVGMPNRTKITVVRQVRHETFTC